MKRAALAPLALLLMAQAPAPPQPEPQPDEIVVTGARRGCRIRFADREMGDREFDARAKEWAAGRPVRVVLPESAGKECMVRIAFRLARRGVTAIEYVDRADPLTAGSSEAPATPR